jgi:hypothetical protein
VKHSFMDTVKPVHVVTFINQSPIFKSHIFLVLTSQI